MNRKDIIKTIRDNIEQYEEFKRNEKGFDKKLLLQLFICQLEIIEIKIYLDSLK